MTKALQKRIDAARKRCEKAFEGVEVGTYVWCCHHETRLEMLYQSPFARIEYMLDNKEDDELVTRFNNFRPVKTAFVDTDFAVNRTGYQSLFNRVIYNVDLTPEEKRQLARLHRKEVPNHTFKNGSIFG